MTAPQTGLDREPGQLALTVADLVAFLKTQEQDLQLVVSKDSEGNGFSPLSAVEHAMYLAVTTWAGETYPTPEDIAADPRFTEKDDGAPDGAVRVLVLWPIN